VKYNPLTTGLKVGVKNSLTLSSQLVKPALTFKPALIGCGGTPMTSGLPARLMLSSQTLAPWRVFQMALLLVGFRPPANMIRGTGIATHLCQMEMGHTGLPMSLLVNKARGEP